MLLSRSALIYNLCDTDCSLQLLHVYYAFEKIITDFSERGANFQIVFFQGK